MAASEEARAFASFAAVGAGLAVDAEYVVVSASKLGLHVANRDPEQAAGNLQRLMEGSRWSVRRPPPTTRMTRDGALPQFRCMTLTHV
jgi:hypothetical protein